MRLGNLTHQEREYSRCVLVVFVIVTIEKNILSSTVTMQVTVKGKVSLVCKLGNKLLRVVDGRMKNFTWVFPPSVEIAAGQTAPVVPIDDSIWVEHWHNLEHKFVSQLIGLGIIADQKVYDTLHHK